MADVGHASDVLILFPAVVETVFDSFVVSANTAREVQRALDQRPTPRVIQQAERTRAM